MAEKTKKAKKAKRSKALSLSQFVERFNDVADGRATFDRISTDAKLDKPFPFKVGEEVPVTRTGVAVYCGMSYNATLQREKSTREKGINLREMEQGKRGRQTDVDAINAEIAARDAANSLTD